MALLLATITGFLISEAVGFYALEGVVTTKTWVKAILTEVCFIFVSAYRADTKLQSAFVVFARVGVFGLMLYAITSTVALTGLNQVSEIDTIKEKIVIVEQQIEEKQKLVDLYIGKGWGNNARIQEQAKQKLVDELLRLKSEQISGKNEKAAEVITWNTWARGFFRIVLMSISVLISRKLFRF
jgi:hypothetical protein